MEVDFIVLRTETKLIVVVKGWLKILRPPNIKLEKRSLPASCNHEETGSTVIAILA